jgi:zinc dependent phospholipase C
MYARGAMSLLGLVALGLLCWPGEAHAWGPVTHLVHGSQILQQLSSLAPALQEILRRHRLPYLYGCIAADIMHAKKFTSSLYTHCHCWPVGWQIVESARTEREEAFAWGYVSHLAADVLSHNHFVPVQMVVSFEARSARHLYWEARFDAAQRRDRWRLIRSVLDHRYADCDSLVERVVERTLFSFRTNKRIFNSVMALQQAAQWQRMVRGLGARSRYPLRASEVERFNRLCNTAIHDLLVRGRQSASQAADPTGRDSLDRAAALRRKLRSLQRRGGMPEAVTAELNALRPAPSRRRSAHAAERGTGRRTPAPVHDPIEDPSGDLVLG